MAVTQIPIRKQLGRRVHAQRARDFIPVCLSILQIGYIFFNSSFAQGDPGLIDGIGEIQFGKRVQNLLFGVDLVVAGLRPC